ncbi:UNVERIFIED_CONTAM: hypothetical protein K2H54_059407 [Gekko kuhli]
MANTTTPVEQEESRDELIISKQELVDIHKDLHRTLREAVEEIVLPLKTQFNDFMQELRDTAKKAQDNAETCATLQKEVSKLQNSETDTNLRLLALENRWRQHNLKFRGFEEGVEENKDLALFMDKVLREARLKGKLTFKENKIIVLLDLSTETLEKRKSLKLFSAKLYAANIRFRWSPASDIVVYKNGAQHLAYDFSSGKDLLKICGIPITPEEELLDQK